MRSVFFIMLLPVLVSAEADSLIYKFWISFTDKKHSIYSIDSPHLFLTQRSIDRRMNQNIPVIDQDLPISSLYIDSIQDLGFNVLNRSRWLNGLIISTNDSSLVSQLILSFVKDIYYFGKWNNSKMPQKISSKLEVDFLEIEYGESFNQLSMLNGTFLHRENFRGEDKVIAVLDAGFSNVDTLHVFQHLFNNGQILGTWDFVEKEAAVYEDHSHGMMVLSIMGANDEGRIIGASPHASFWLLRSEDVSSENIIEEYNWLCAAEFSDSVGVDIINSSLGYTTFDEKYQNHSYSDMNGRTAPASIAASIAASKGIIVVSSAGNLGSSDWHYISSPADADSILSVGAVDVNRHYASFSSYGPSFDGRVKPTIVAQGKNTIVASEDNDIFSGSGTSFSSPIIAGMTACLWQAHPYRKNMEIIDAILLSSSLYSTPNDSLGYGIPNYALAHQLLTQSQDLLESDVFAIIPNPITSNSNLYIYTEDVTNIIINVFDIGGRKIRANSYLLNRKKNNAINLSYLLNYVSGIYFLEIQVGSKTFIEKIAIIE